MQQATTNYESVPYLSQSFSFTHPARLAATARLFGLDAAPSNVARILELGCASGINLAGLALSLPGSELIGVDLSETQVDAGKEVIKELGLSNVTLERLDIKDVGARFGTFDYIICHGVFSWVPQELQQNILETCRSQLNPHGVAYISYNTLPGWYPRKMIRDMLLYHAEQFRDSEMFIPQARSMVTLLQRSLRSVDAPLAVYLRNSLTQIDNHPDWYLRHDVLEETNEPLYFHAFAAMAEAAGLQYLGDAELSKMVDFGFPEDVRKALHLIADDIVRFEQYLDFLWNRGFRRSLLCHADRELTREQAPSRVAGLHAASPLKRTGTLIPKDGTRDVIRLENPSGGFIETNDPYIVHALETLENSWPQSVSFDDLYSAAQDSLAEKYAPTPEAAAAERDHLALGIWNLASRGLLELSDTPLPFTTEVSATPAVSALARAQVEQGLLEVSSIRNEVVALSPNEARLLSQMDGTRTASALRERLIELGVPETDVPEGWVAETIRRFADEALLS